jgi:hypothetical protein
MGEILGITIADFPNLKFKPHLMPNVMLGNLATGFRDKPELTDANNWPEEMKRQWGRDMGLSAGQAAQEYQIEQFRKVRGALDEFQPDILVFLYRELGENFRDHLKTPYYIVAMDEINLKLFTLFGRRENYHEEDPDRVDTIKLHKEAALYLVRHLQDAGLNPVFAMESMNQTNGLGHNCLAALLHTDWDNREFKTPIVPIPIDPFGFLRTRNNEGLSVPWNKDAPRTLTPKEAFNLGVEMARAFKESPWRVAIVAACDWSHANDGPIDQGRLHPDIEADQARFEEWKNNKFDNWGESWTFEEMEEHAQWEMLVTIILAGAMTHIGAKVQYADFHPTWLFNDDFVTTIFGPK